MLNKTGIGAIVFYVADIDRTEAFYKDTLGLTLQRMEGEAGEFDGADWLMADVGGISLIFFQMEGKRGDSPVIVFNLDEGGIDGIVEGLASKGVTIVTPVSHAPDGGWTADFADPDGHTLSLYQEADKAR
ncbi:VOC family protein [Henriciella litoralis]|uniref:VOC family protein n=1 Tax=Henriciella litoralis TaxID=568102 RepID=UPI0009FBAA00|nr:VOC family protein [Henriciella litoralis]